MPLAQQHDAVRDSWDSLTLFARGHAGRLAPYVAPKHSALAREQSLANKQSAKRYCNGPAGDAELGRHFPCFTATYVPCFTSTDAELGPHFPCITATCVPSLHALLVQVQRYKY
jgi:hypothetical protein